MNMEIQPHAQLVPGSVQETMVMCFLDRACYSPMFPVVLDDPLAVDILDKFKVQLSARHFRKSEMPALSILLRARNFDDAVRKFLKQYPQATIINLAAGLETSFSRVDNGQLRWYDIDLPDAIDFRRQFIPESARNLFVKADLMDFSWFDQIEHDPAKGVMIVASGILCYFTRAELAKLTTALASRFPGAEMIFEYYSKPVVWGNNFFFWSKGMSARLAYGAFDLNRVMHRLTRRVQLVERFPYYSRYPSKLNLKWRTRFFMKASDALQMMEFIHWRLI